MKDSIIDFFYSIRRFVLGIRYDVKNLLQFVFRPDHVCDSDIWNLYSTVVRKNINLIRAYKRKKRMGYHFVDGVEIHENPTDEQEKSAIDAWEKVLDDIVFAFEFCYQENYDDWKAKNIRRKLKRKFGDWDAETKENEFCFFWRTIKDGEYKNYSELVTGFDEMNEEDMAGLEKELGKDWRKKVTRYHNKELHDKLEKKASDGFVLFGKYFQSLWD